MKNLHINNQIWRYKVHKSCVEIRSPQNKKFIVNYSHFLPPEKELEVVEECCYQSEYGDEFVLFKDMNDNKEFSCAKGTDSFDSEKCQYFFAVTPGRVKSYIKKKILQPA